MKKRLKKKIEKQFKEQVLPAKKAEPTATTPVKAEPVAEKTSEKKATPVKKEKASTKVLKPEMTVQFAQVETTKDEIIAGIKKEWTASGRKVKDINTLDIFIKVEDKKAYYVINEDIKGTVELSA